MCRVDVRVFGVPERIKWIEEKQSILGLPDESIFIDYDHNGCVPTAKRAWLKKTDKPYTMVLADDAQLCDNFMSYCERVLKVHPDKIISLFPLQFMRPIPGSLLPTKSPYVLSKVLSGCGIIMRTEWVEPCITDWPPDAQGDDTSIQAWANKNDIKIVTTLPALIQHVGDQSIHDPKRVLGRTPYFEKNPANVDWDSQYLTPWTNIIRD